MCSGADDCPKHRSRTLYSVKLSWRSRERERELPLVTNGANVSREVHPDHSSLLTLPNLYNVFLGVNHVAFGLTTRNKKLLGAPGIATRSKDPIRGSWPYY